MKRFFILLLCLFALCGCSNSNEDGGTLVLDEGEMSHMLEGGWYINPELPAINDAVFDQAASEYTEEFLSPVFYLGSQVVAGSNRAYLAYANDSFSSYKVVIVYQDLQNNCSITKTADFDIAAISIAEDASSSQQLMGGWTSNTELPNMLDEETNAIFEQAVSQLTGVGYQPVNVLATQLVSGTNYLFLTVGTTVTAEPVSALYLITVYAPLSGEASISNISKLNIADYNK